MIHENIMAKADAMQHELEMSRKSLGPIPDPREWAWRLPEAVVSTMTSPQCIRNRSHCASENVAALLRPYGLCEYPTRNSKGWALTNFGCAVLKELIGDEG